MLLQPKISALVLCPVGFLSIFLATPYIPYVCDLNYSPFSYLPIPAILSPSPLQSPSTEQKKRESDGMKRELQVSIEVLSSQAAHLRASTSHKSAIACVYLKVAPLLAIARGCLGPLCPIFILQSSTCLLSDIKTLGQTFNHTKVKRFLTCCASVKS